MNTKFYAHLIEVDSIIIELDKMNLSLDEKKHLTQLIDVSLHNAILDMVLSQLKDCDKRAFIVKLTHEDNQKIWEFLNQHVDKIEDKIKLAAEKLKRELHEDIRKAHVLKGKK